MRAGLFQRGILVGLISFGLIACESSDEEDDDVQQQMVSLSGTVRSLDTGNPLAGAQVSATVLTEQELESTTWETVTVYTDEKGNYEIEDIQDAEQVIVSVVAEGHSSGLEVLKKPDELDDLVFEEFLPRADIVAEFDPSVGADITDPLPTQVTDPTILSILPNSLETEFGEPPVGMVTATVSILDPSDDAGVLSGVQREDGEDGYWLSSYGALSISLQDSVGDRLLLKEGFDALVRIPLAEDIYYLNAPVSLDLYALNELTGMRAIAGVADLTPYYDYHYYVGRVTQLAEMTAGQPYADVVNVNGCVEYKSGEPAAFAKILVEGESFIGQSSGYADANGRFLVSARADSDATVFAQAGSQLKAEELETRQRTFTYNGCFELAIETVSIELVWGETPRDLDGQVLVPRYDGNEVQQVYFGNPKISRDETESECQKRMIANPDDTEDENVEDCTESKRECLKRVEGLRSRDQEICEDNEKLQEIVQLESDNDDKNGYGPELILANEFPVVGVYPYIVTNFVGDGSIVTSPTQVNVKVNGQPSTFIAANATGAETGVWHVFNLEVDSNFNVELKPVQRFTSMEAAISVASGQD